MDVRTSFMQHLPLVTRNHQPFLLLYPLAFESFDLSEFDVVISNSSAFCKGVVTSPDTLHICYCLTPMRWVWNYQRVRRARAAGAGRPAGPARRHQSAALLGRRHRPERRPVPGHLAHGVAAHPQVLPTRIERDLSARQLPTRSPAQPEPGRGLLPDRVAAHPVQADRPGRGRLHETGIKLKIVGSGGRAESALRARAGRTVEFVGRVSDDELQATCTRVAGPWSFRARRTSASRRSKPMPAADR